MQLDRPGDELFQQESEDTLANCFTSKYSGNLLMVKRNCDISSDLHWYTWWAALKSRAFFFTNQRQADWRFPALCGSNMRLRHVLIVLLDCFAQLTSLTRVITLFLVLKSL